MTDTITLPRAVGIVLEGFTLPDAARKILETAYWSDAALVQQAEQVQGKPAGGELQRHNDYMSGFNEGYDRAMQVASHQTKQCGVPDIGLKN